MPIAPSPAPVTPAKAIAAPATVSLADDALAGLRASLDAARTLRDPTQRAVEFGRNLEALIARDPAVALDYVRQLEAGAVYTQGMLMVLSSIGRSNPDRALALAAEMATTREQRAIYSSLFAQLAAADPAAAASRLAVVPAGEARDNALRAVADGWARGDFSAALDWAQKLAGPDREPAMEAVLAAITPTDPMRAIDLAQNSLSGAAFDRTLLSALRSLTRTDVQAAAALVAKLSPGAVQSQASYSVARALAADNPPGAVAWSRTLPDAGLRVVVLNNILDVWAAKNPVAAGQAVVQIPAGKEQDAAASYLAPLLAANPTQAIAWAQSLANESSRQAAVISLASAWAQRDPAAAAQWAGSLAPGDTRLRALNGAMSYWAAQDADAAQKYVFGLAADTQASVAAHLAPSLAQRDPVAAIAWTQTLPSSEAREAALIAAYARWLGNAPTDAKNWLASANLPAATKARLAGL